MSNLPKMFCRLGEALYGPRWKSELGLALGVTRNRIQNWSDGSSRIPPEILATLRDVTNKRRNEVLAAWQGFRGAVDPTSENDGALS